VTQNTDTKIRRHAYIFSDVDTFEDRVAQLLTRPDNGTAVKREALAAALWLEHYLERHQSLFSENVTDTFNNCTSLLVRLAAEVDRLGKLVPGKSE
jgi:hypothetical protein